METADRASLSAKRLVVLYKLIFTHMPTEKVHPECLGKISPLITDVAGS